MSWRRKLVFGLIGVALLVEVALVSSLVIGRADAGAQEQVAETPPPDSSPSRRDLAERTERRTYEELVDALERRQRELDEREAALRERERQLAFGVATLREEAAELRELRAEVASEERRMLALRSPSFERLLETYEVMAPESVANALAELWSRDEAATVDLLLAMTRRHAGAAMDALGELRPDVAAAISHRVWSRDPTLRKDPR
jgi:flagellar motility protein MotE (MotC chaperone)